MIRPHPDSLPRALAPAKFWHAIAQGQRQGQGKACGDAKSLLHVFESYMTTSPGIAKNAFSATYQRTPWKGITAPTKQSQYPLLDAFLLEGRLSYFDYTWTLNLLSLYPNANQEVALGICHLILSAKAGHLCIKIADHCVYPTVAEVWIQNSEIPFTALDPDTLSHKIASGLRNIPSDLISEINKEKIGSYSVSTPLCIDHNRIYLHRHWAFESHILNNIKKLSSIRPELMPDKESLIRSINALSSEGRLLSEQAEAILKSCLSTISLITGGPGTGKTYTVSYLIQLFWMHLSIDQKARCEIALAAPTGKAASHLQTNVMRMVSSLEGFPALSAKTLHALLGIKSMEESDIPENGTLLSADLILVDESSMIDVRLMSRLLGSIKEGARLILIGDPYQLPAVEAGSLFADFVRSNAIPCTSLKTCLRTELLPILTFAQTIRSGNIGEAFDLLNSNLHPCLSHLQLPSDIIPMRKALWEHVKSYLPLSIQDDTDPEQLLKALNRFCLLSPLRKGPFGVDELNRYLWEKICSVCPKTGLLAVPILIVSNDYRQDLFNGEMGLLIRYLPFGEMQKDYGLFFSKTGTEVRKIPMCLLPKYEYAYCISVHKSQGSEFEHVVLMMPEGSELFGREVLYTAVTRAKKRLEIAGSDNVIAKVIGQSGERLSGIRSWT